MYAHALIELDGRTIERGEEVNASDFSDTDQFDELVEGGAIRDEEYDEAADEVEPPDVVEIDGVRYVKSKDGSSANSKGEARNG